ncbi:MAG: hypothetical protein HYY32_05490, partial [Chloroflexi bacterium]|nr:hypothetical protein [Chloroflexota bacterium]
PYYDGSASSWDLQFGIGLAKEHCFAPRLFDGSEAYRLGIVNRVVPLQRLDEEVAKHVRGISNMPADGIAIGKGVQTAFLDIMGYRKGFNSGYLGHGVHGNMRWEPGEFVFFSQRAAKGAKGFFTERDERTRGIWDNDARFTRVRTREQRGGTAEPPR